MGGQELTAKTIEAALEERIVEGSYGRGAPLPPVRRLAVEFGTSPSTVSRALHELERRGWIQVTNRRGAVVSRSIPEGDARRDRAVRVLRPLAHRWRLSGGTRQEFLSLIEGILDEAYRVEASVIFVECNGTDLARMSAQVRQAVPLRIMPMLLGDALRDPNRLSGALVLTPYFHLAEIRELAVPDCELTPLNFVLSTNTIQALVDLRPKDKVAVIGRDERTRRQIEGMVHQYSPVHVDGAVLADPTRVDELVDRVDVVISSPATALLSDRLARARRLVIIELVLESGPELLDLVARAAAIATGEAGRDEAGTALTSSPTFVST